MFLKNPVKNKPDIEYPLLDIILKQESVLSDFQIGS